MLSVFHLDALEGHCKGGQKFEITTTFSSTGKIQYKLVINEINTI